MAEAELELPAKGAYSVIAPAGCGKTQLIAEALRTHSDPKPALVLTHTNAGRAALEQRLVKAGVPSSRFRVTTLDSWSIRLASHFPAHCGLPDKTLRIENSSTDYQAVRVAAVNLLVAGHVNEVLQATYSRVLVDEYQDCNLKQHALVVALSECLPTAVLGDPLQAIFDFGGPVVDWEQHVRADFPSHGRLGTPWRWDRVGASALGQWLLGIRKPLRAGMGIDLSDAPEEVQWVELRGDGQEVLALRLKAALTRAPNRGGTVVVIADSKDKQSQLTLASRTPGALMVEALDLKDLVQFSRDFKPSSPSSLGDLVAFAADLMCGLSEQQLLKRVASLRKGTAHKDATPVEGAAVAFAEGPSLETAAIALKAFADGEGVRVYRPDVLRLCVAALRNAHKTRAPFFEAAIRERERNRHLSRNIPARAIGSTLLLKGLESDVAVILEPEKMNARNLYVAMTRGSRKLVICSTTSMLKPKGV